MIYEYRMDKLESQMGTWNALLSQYCGKLDLQFWIESGGEVPTIGMYVMYLEPMSILNFQSEASQSLD